MAAATSRKAIADAVAAELDGAVGSLEATASVLVTLTPENYATAKVLVIPGARQSSALGRTYSQQTAVIEVHIIKYCPDATTTADLEAQSDLVDELIETIDAEAFRSTDMEEAQFMRWEMDEPYDDTHYRELRLFWSTVYLYYQLKDEA